MHQDTEKQRDDAIPERLLKKEKPVRCDGHRERMIGRLFRQLDREMDTRDLLEILLYYMIPRADTRDRAVYLMMDNHDILMEVLTADVSKLTRIPGIGKKTACLLRLTGAAVSRIQPFSPAYTVDTSFICPEYTAKQFTKKLKADNVNETWVIGFNAALKPDRPEKLLARPLKGTSDDARLILDFMLANHYSCVAIARCCAENPILPGAEERQTALCLQRAFQPLERKILHYLLVGPDSFCHAGMNIRP